MKYSLSPAPTQISIICQPGGNFLGIIEFPSSRANLHRTAFFYFPAQNIFLNLIDTIIHKTKYAAAKRLKHFGDWKSTEPKNAANHVNFFFSFCPKALQRELPTAASAWGVLGDVMDEFRISYIIKLKSFSDLLPRQTSNMWRLRICARFAGKTLLSLFGCSSSSCRFTITTENWIRVESVISRVYESAEAFSVYSTYFTDC